MRRDREIARFLLREGTAHGGVLDVYSRKKGNEGTREGRKAGFPNACFLLLSFARSEKRPGRGNSIPHGTALLGCAR